MSTGEFWDAGELTPEEIRLEFDTPSPHYPETALRAAEKAGACLTDLFLDMVERARRETLEGNPPAGNAHIFAMLLLAKLEEPRAFDVIADFFALPEAAVEALVGDFLTEDLGRVLASVCGGHIEPLARIVEDRSRAPYVRAAGLTALCALVQRRLVSRPQAAAYVRTLMGGALEDEADAVWDTLGCAVIDLYLDDLFEDVREAIRSGLIGDWMLEVADVDEVEGNGLEAALAELDEASHLQRVADIVAETSWWDCFDPTADLDDDDDFDDDALDDDALAASEECGDPDCHDHAHAAPPYRRETPKTGRNDPCPCGSGKKYKKCCLA